MNSVYLFCVLLKYSQLNCYFLNKEVTPRFAKQIVPAGKTSLIVNAMLQRINIALSFLEKNKEAMPQRIKIYIHHIDYVGTLRNYILYVKVQLYSFDTLTNDTTNKICSTEQILFSTILYEGVKYEGFHIKWM